MVILSFKDRQTQMMMNQGQRRTDLVKVMQQVRVHHPHQECVVVSVEYQVQIELVEQVLLPHVVQR